MEYALLGLGLVSLACTLAAAIFYGSWRNEQALHAATQLSLRVARDDIKKLEQLRVNHDSARDALVAENLVLEARIERIMEELNACTDINTARDRAARVLSGRSSGA